jgi:hypothetical protein
MSGIGPSDQTEEPYSLAGARRTLLGGAGECADTDGGNEDGVIRSKARVMKKPGHVGPIPA